MDRIRVLRGISKLITSDYVYGAMLLRCKVTPKENMESCLGVTFIKGEPVLYYNPSYPPEKEPDPSNKRALSGILMHEATHLFLLHPYRLRQAVITGRVDMRDPVEHLSWTDATEHTCNDGIEHLVPTGIFFPELKSWTSQEVHDYLIRQACQLAGMSLPGNSEGGQDSGGQGSSRRDPARDPKPSSSVTQQSVQDLADLMRAIKTLEEIFDGRINPKDLFPAEGEQAEQDKAKQLVVQVLQEGLKTCGTLPGELGAYLESLIDVRIPLGPSIRKQLQQILLTTPVDKKFLRTYPSRRYSHASGRKRLPGKGICIALDTSGSMSDKELQVLMSEIDRFARKYGVWLVGADAAIFSSRKYSPGDWKKFSMARGGTDFQPAIDTAVEMHMTKLIYMTDMGAPIPDPKGLELLWIVTAEESDDHHSFPGEKFWAHNYVVMGEE